MGYRPGGPGPARCDLVRRLGPHDQQRKQCLQLDRNVRRCRRCRNCLSIVMLRTDHGRRFPASVNLCPVDLYALRSPDACLPVTVKPAGRAAAARAGGAGSFNSVCCRGGHGCYHLLERRDYNYKCNKGSQQRTPKQKENGEKFSKFSLRSPRRKKLDMDECQIYALYNLIEIFIRIFAKAVNSETLAD